MNNIQVDKTELIGILEDNLKKHTTEYDEAIAGYHAEVVTRLTNALEKAKAGDEYIVNMALVQPQTFEKDYKTIIGMLNLDTVDLVELTEHEYKQYVLDEWHWSSSAKMLNSVYLSK